MVLAQDQKMKISSSSENIILVERMIEDVCDLFEVGEDNFGNILIAVTEAVNNAIQHGNKLDPTKNIHISFKSNNNHIYFKVQDEGNGFDFTRIPDPTAPENIEKPHGRGIFLMNSLADKVEFADNGKTVTLHFNLN
jgi:serine/threonine-protein kinase RsbW